jgi:hypothetical protein
MFMKITFDIFFDVSIVYGFHSIGLSHPLISLFPDILFLEYYKQNCFPFIPSQSYHCWYRMATDYCNSILHPANWLKLL